MKRLTVNIFALQSLKTRKKQYAALIVGIILAMVFSSGTLFFVSCLSSSQKELRRQRYGTADWMVFEMTEENVRQMERDYPGVTYGFARVLGFAYTEEMEDGAAVAWLDGTAADFYQPVLLEGRLPEEEGEIAAERDALLRMGLDGTTPGGTVSLKLLPQNGSEGLMQNAVEKTYLLTGILGDKRRNISVTGPGYEPKIPAILTSASEQAEPGAKEALTAYVTIPKEKNGGLLNLPCETLNVSAAARWNVFEFENVHSQTIFSATLSGVLMLASALGIVNAFNSDLSERKRQIGLLRAVGATKRQIVGIYGRETLLLACVCAPVSLCISYFGVKIITGFMEDFIFLPSWWVLLGSMAAGLVFVLLATLVPLTAAARVSPMQAIRNTELGRKMKRMKIRSKTPAHSADGADPGGDGVFVLLFVQLFVGSVQRHVP